MFFICNGHSNLPSQVLLDHKDELVSQDHKVQQELLVILDTQVHLVPLEALVLQDPKDPLEVLVLLVLAAQLEALGLLVHRDELEGQVIDFSICLP